MRLFFSTPRFLHEVCRRRRLMDAPSAPLTRCACVGFPRRPLVQARLPSRSVSLTSAGRHAVVGHACSSSRPLMRLLYISSDSPTGTTTATFPSTCISVAEAYAHRHHFLDDGQFMILDLCEGMFSVQLLRRASWALLDWRRGGLPYTRQIVAQARGHNALPNSDENWPHEHPTDFFCATNCKVFCVSRRVFGPSSPAQHGAMFPSAWRKVYLPSRFKTVLKAGREFWKTRTSFGSINSDVGSRIAPWQGIVGRPSTDPVAGRARCCDGFMARNSQQWRESRRETPWQAPSNVRAPSSHLQRMRQGEQIRSCVLR